MKKKLQIIATIIIAAFIVSVLSCLTTQEKAARARIDYLTASRGLGMFTMPPSEGETVIANYQDNYNQSRSGEMHSWLISSFRTGWGHSLFHYPDQFHPETAATRLLAKALVEFPNLNIDELDVRSIIQIGDTYFSRWGATSPSRTDVTGNSYFNYTATNNYKFSGVVVRLPR